MPPTFTAPATPLPGIFSVDAPDFSLVAPGA